MTLTITLDCHPPQQCSPNARVGPMVRYRAGRDFKAFVFGEARNQAGSWTAPEKATIKLTFVCKEERIRDIDNWLARWKPGTDGLVAAGVLKADDCNHLTVAGVFFEVDPARAPQTIIEIEAK